MQGKSLQAPNKASLVAAPQDANVLMSSFLEKKTYLMRILTTQLKPNEVGAKIVKRLPIKIPPLKAFKGDRDYERVATWLQEVENLFPAMAVEEHQMVQTAGGFWSRDVLTWWAEYIKDQEIVENEMTWMEFKTFVTSQFTPKYANNRAKVAWLDLRQTHSIKAYIEKFQRAVGILQHVSDYDKHLKFIH